MMPQTGLLATTSATRYHGMLPALMRMTLRAYQLSRAHRRSNLAQPTGIRQGTSCAQFNTALLPPVRALVVLLDSARQCSAYQVLLNLFRVAPPRERVTDRIASLKSLSWAAVL